MRCLTFFGVALVIFSITTSSAIKYGSHTCEIEQNLNQEGPPAARAAHERAVAEAAAAAAADPKDPSSYYISSNEIWLHVGEEWLNVDRKKKTQEDWRRKVPCLDPMDPECIGRMMAMAEQLARYFDEPKALKAFRDSGGPFEVKVEHKGPSPEDPKKPWTTSIIVYVGPRKEKLDRFYYYHEDPITRKKDYIWCLSKDQRLTEDAGHLGMYAWIRTWLRNTFEPKDSVFTYSTYKTPSRSALSARTGQSVIDNRVPLLLRGNSSIPKSALGTSRMHATDPSLRTRPSAADVFAQHGGNF